MKWSSEAGSYLERLDSGSPHSGGCAEAKKPGMTINGKGLMTHYTLCSVLIQLQFRMFRNGFEMFIIRKNRNFISYGDDCYCHIYWRDSDSLAPQFLYREEAYK